MGQGTGKYIHFPFQASPTRAGNRILQRNPFLHSGQAPREVTFIRSMAPIHLMVHYPKTAAGREELSKRAADVHASAVTQRIKSLNCPTSQKLALLDAVIETAKEKSKAQT